MANEEPHRSPADDVFNAASHLAATMLSIMGVVLLIVYASVDHKPWHIVSFSVYGFCLISLFLVSTLHHSIRGSERTEKLFRRLDYVAIFLLIAGTFTPLCLIPLRGPFGWSVFGVVWGLAALGMVLVSAMSSLPPWVRGTMYVVLGWLGALIAKPVLDVMGLGGLGLLVGGGAFYTIGVVILGLKAPNWRPGFEHHELWHVLVAAGALCHYLMMLWYVLPLP